MSIINFLKYPATYFNDTEFVAYISKVNGEDELHIKLSETLKFPDYYGYNWNALYDCLRDFHWIAQKGIVLVHNETPNLDATSLKTYLEILSDSVKDWKFYENHYFKVIFPREAEKIIKNAINFQ